MVRPPTHSFPHRGSPSTSHARVRWQPYNSSLHSIPPASSPLAYLVTPASSTSSVSPSPRFLPEPDRTRHAQLPPRESKLRDIQKSKFALSLVDQAIKSLCDIWPHQDIPAVFLTSGRPVVSPPSSSGQAANILHSTCRNSQLPSPISPTTQSIPIVPPTPPRQTPFTQHQPCDIAPIKCFVHEVLRRSRTSGTVLQTALCYLEAIRAKVPDLVRKEKSSFSFSSPVGSDDNRISKAEVGIDIDIDTDLGEQALPDASSNCPLATVRINPISYEADTSLDTEQALDAEKVTAHVVKTKNASLPPLPPLPSPLLCPRRTFLASLILASKFVQDRCYSNRAWAKLSGLPPREIGRCERALGEALEWRLWVGKLPAAQSTSGRVLTKSKSEGDINLYGSVPMVHTAGDLDAVSTLCSVVPSTGSRVSPLRRRATVPPLGNPYLEGPQTGRSDNVSPAAYSSSPSTPGLSYSPTSTESSLGDRTVQMSTFMDVSTPPPGQFATFTGAQNDKVLATLPVPSNAFFVHATLQETTFPTVAHPVDPQFWLPHGVAPNVWTFNEA